MSEKKLIGWRTANFLWETDNIEVAKNWEPHHEILPIFDGDINTKLLTPTNNSDIVELLSALKLCKFDSLNMSLDDIRRVKEIYNKFDKKTSNVDNAGE